MNDLRPFVVAQFLLGGLERSFSKERPMLAIPVVVASLPLAVWLENSVRLARFLTLVVLAVSVIPELVRGRSRPGWWRGVALRAAAVSCLFLGWRGRTVYGTALGWLLDTALDVELVSRASWGQLTEVAGSLYHRQSALALEAGGVGPHVLFSAVAATPLLFQASLLGMASLARLVASGLGLMGPVVLALSVSGGSGGLIRWARGLLAVLAWPILVAVLVDLTVGTALGYLSPTHASDAAFQAVALGVLLGGVALAVPLIGLTGASSALKAGAVAWCACAGIPAALRRRGFCRVSAGPARRCREDTKPPREPAKRAPLDSKQSSECAPMDYSELLRATPALPRAGLRIEGFADPPASQSPPPLPLDPGRRPPAWPPKAYRPPPWPPRDRSSDSADRTTPCAQVEATGKTKPVMKPAQANQANRLRRSRS